LNVLILSRRSYFYSTARLKTAAEERGHTATVTDPLSISLSIDEGRPMVHNGGVDLSKIDVVIPRIGLFAIEFGVAVVKQFQMMGIPVVNRSLSIMRARDKLRCNQILTRKNIEVPRTVMTRNPADLKASVERVGGLPVILKFLQGAQGVGVILADTFRSAESTLDAFWSMNQNLMIQEFVAEAEGKDLRVIVVGGQVVAVMKRKARDGEFRSNIHRGGWAELADVPDEILDVAVRAADTIGLDVAGVDILESARGPLTLEVNASPGLEAIEKVTDKDVAGEIIRFAETRVALRRESINERARRPEASGLPVKSDETKNPRHADAAADRRSAAV